MRTFKLSRAPVLACGALAVSVALAAPAIGNALDQGGSTQPPPGAPAVRLDTSDAQDSNNQPPAGAKPVKLKNVAGAPVTQPDNANPQPAKSVPLNGPSESEVQPPDAEDRAEQPTAPNAPDRPEQQD